MIRSMNSALSGLRNHQLMIDVVGNDIANVSTVGFKGSTTVFSDVLTQTLQGAGAPGAATGGTNPAQIGLGSRFAGTVQSFTQGTPQRTDRGLDMAIEGDGFFVVDSGGQQLYTRAGAFQLDGAGRLTTPDGMLVQGWQADASGAVDANGALGPLQIRIGDLLPPAQTTDVGLGGNLSATAAVGTVVSLTAGVFDAQGNEIPLSIDLTKTAADEWTATATSGVPPVAVVLTDAVLTFDGSGELTAPADRQIDIAAGAIPGTGAITLSLGGAGQPGRITQFAGSGTAAVQAQDGSPVGALQSFDVGQDGTIVGSYSNGLMRPIGRLALAVFANPGGLAREGGVWRQTPNSGLAQVGAASSGGRGVIAGGMLEMSNVDLAEEFTRLIVAQRGFQGNARVITTSDELLQEVVNLRR